MVNFSPGRGSEQRGLRPALIIQNDAGNQYAATTIIAAITSRIRIYPVTVSLGTWRRSSPSINLVSGEGSASCGQTSSTG